MKKPKVSHTIFFSILVLTLFASSVQAQETQVKITGIKSGKGKIILNVFKDDESYDKQLPYKKFVFDKKDIAAGSLSVIFKVEPGTYGITLLDDENNNGKMDMNFIKMPKEGFGFSNFFMEKMKKPSFSDFKVNLTLPVNKINVSVKYI